MPKVSIIIPVYNSEKYLHECLDSVVNQTLKEIEIICVNDGSTDSSPGILADYAKKDSRIKLINKPNSGYGHTMNVGLENATGEYIGIVESDDYALPEMFDTLYATAQKYGLDLVKSDFRRFLGDPAHRKFSDIMLTHDAGYYNKVLNPGDDINVFQLTMNIWTGLYSRDFLKKNDIRFNETPGASYQDNGFHFQTLAMASKIYFVNKAFYMNRRDNPGSSVKSKDKVFCMCNEYEFIRDFLNRNPVLQQKFMPVYWFRKFHAYLFTYERISEKFKRTFLERFSLEFKRGLADGELDRKHFKPHEWSELQAIIENPDAYYRRTFLHRKIRPVAKKILLSNRITLLLYHFFEK